MNSGNGSQRVNSCQEQIWLTIAKSNCDFPSGPDCFSSLSRPVSQGLRPFPGVRALRLSPVLFYPRLMQFDGRTVVRKSQPVGGSEIQSLDSPIPQQAAARSIRVGVGKWSVKVEKQRRKGRSPHFAQSLVR